jgi:LuxR family maltose regulon positive regulatory protein
MSLLSTLQRRRPDWAYPRTMLDGPTPVREPVTAQSLVDPLSDREIDVLRLLTSELDGPSIARELVVSLNTVRTHTKHIYTKLGVNSRRAAVRRAHQLGLLKITR